MSQKNKQFLGMPMNWDHKNMFKNFWNKDSDEIFPPKKFGIGWDINFHALLKSFGIIRKENTKQELK